MRSKASDFVAGQPVLYRPRGMRPASGPRHEGVVTSVGPRFVFVRFGDMHPAAPGKACDPRDLVAAT